MKTQVEKKLPATQYHNEEATRLLLNKGVLLQLMKYARRSDVSTQRFSILTICNFSLIRSEKRNMLQQRNA